MLFTVQNRLHLIWTPAIFTILNIQCDLHIVFNLSHSIWRFYFELYLSRELLVFLALPFLAHLFWILHPRQCCKYRNICHKVCRLRCRILRSYILLFLWFVFLGNSILFGGPNCTNNFENRMKIKLLKNLMKFEASSP